MKSIKRKPNGHFDYKNDSPSICKDGLSVKRVFSLSEISLESALKIGDDILLATKAAQSDFTPAEQAIIDHLNEADLWEGR